MRALYKEEAENQWNWTCVLEQPATNPCAKLKTRIEKKKEEIHKDHLVYLVTSSLAQPKGTQLWEHSPWSLPPGTPYSLLHRRRFYCTEQSCSAIQLLLHWNLLCVYFALLGSKARDGELPWRHQWAPGVGVLGAPPQPLRYHSSAQTSLSSITESVYGQNCFISFRGLEPSSPARFSPSDTPQQAAGLLKPFSGTSLKHCAEDTEELLRVCLPNHLPLGQEGRLTLSFPSKGKCRQSDLQRGKNFST